MPASALRRESRNVQRFVGLPSAEKARLWPTLDAILEDARPEGEDIANQLAFGALNDVLITGIVARQYEKVYAALGKVLGRDASRGKQGGDAAADFPGGKSLPIREQRPLAKVSAR